MEITLDTSEGYTIKSYSLSHIQVNDQTYTNSLIVSPDKIITPWQPRKVETLSQQDCLTITQLNPDVVILGTGAKQILPPIEILTFFTQQKIGIEIMNTGAACRTYNVLVSEHRKVVAAFIF